MQFHILGREAKIEVLGEEFLRTLKYLDTYNRNYVSRK